MENIGPLYCVFGCDTALDYALGYITPQTQYLGPIFSIYDLVVYYIILICTVYTVGRVIFVTVNVRNFLPRTRKQYKRVRLASTNKQRQQLEEKRYLFSVSFRCLQSKQFSLELYSRSLKQFSSELYSSLVASFACFQSPPTVSLPLKD